MRHALERGEFVSTTAQIEITTAPHRVEALLAADPERGSFRGQIHTACEQPD